MERNTFWNTISNRQMKYSSVGNTKVRKSLTRFYLENDISQDCSSCDKQSPVWWFQIQSVSINKEFWWNTLNLENHQNTSLVFAWQKCICIIEILRIKVIFLRELKLTSCKSEYLHYFKKTLSFGVWIQNANFLRWNCLSKCMEQVLDWIFLYESSRICH